MASEGLTVGKVHARAIALEIALQRLITHLIEKRVVSAQDIEAVLDGAADAAQADARIVDDGRGEAARCIGSLYLRD